MQGGSEDGSRLGLWDAWYARFDRKGYFGDATTLRLAAEWLRDPAAGIALVEDWGCGLAGLSSLLDPVQVYVGIDGSRSRFATIIADLESYRSAADAVHLRHVLEHNPRWERVLDNALGSFRKRMVLTLFTPWCERTGVLARYPDFNGTGATMVDIGFRRDDIVGRFGDLRWTAREALPTSSQYGVEHMFFLER